MKKQKVIKPEKEKAKKNPSTNYAQDSHSQFCKRCYAYNKGCPNTKSKLKDSECRL